jgi:hypothetical protein
MSVIIPPEVSTVMLTGAGFSVPAGLPLTKDLVRRGREQLPIEFIEALDTLAKEILQECIREEIEEILTSLRVLELYAKQYKTDIPDSIEANNYHTKLFPLEMGVYYLVWTALLRPSNPPPPDLYDAFLKCLGDDVACATLNYDLLLETIFRKNQRTWHYPLQGETRFRNELMYDHESFYLSRNDDPSSIPYLKLHGSFNWHYCWRCHYFRIIRDDWFGMSDFELDRPGRDPVYVKGGGTLACAEDGCSWSDPQRGQAVLKPLIIPPARLKEYSQAPVRRQWAFFDLLLVRARQVILVGTSIRDGDVLLVNSLNLLGLKNRQLKSIVVIDRMQEIAAKVERLSEVETIWYPSLEAYIN